MKHILWIFFGLSGMLSAQNVTAPIHSPGSRALERYDVLYGQGIFHSAVKPYRRDDIACMAWQVYRSAPGQLDLFDLQQIFDQNNEFLESCAGIEQGVSKIYIDSTRTFYTPGDDGNGLRGLRRESDKPFLKSFYRTPAHLFEINTPDFYLKVNPILHLGMGRSRGEGSNLFINQRGIRLRGGIDRKIYFFSEILESQVRFPNYINTFTGEANAVPGAGFYKGYELDFLDVRNGRDFLLAQAYIGLDISKHVGLQFGHGTNFIGDGYRSLLLSDFSAPYFYLKLNTRVWKFHYQNIFAELAAGSAQDVPGDERIPRKFMAGHYLSFNIRDNLSIGVYEAVIFDRGKDRFELQYLNPVIFYRTVEGMIGSPDNAMIGLTAKWNLWKKVSLYGQFVLDDILIREILDGNLGWWGNKFGFQAGVKYFNAFNVDHLDLQVEVNQVRPYTYSHRDSSSTYSHYNQALAHPLGANFSELILMARYRPVKRLQLEGRIFLVGTGEGNDTLNVGTNILRANRSRIGNYGMFIGQGDPVDINFIQLSASYQLKHQMYIDLKFGSRRKTSAVAERSLSTTYFTAALRWNLFRPDPVF